MASKNQVTLTFAGDADKLEKTFDRLGSRSEDFGRTVERGAGDGFDRAGEKADNFDTKMMGTHDLLTGFQDTFTGFGQILKGNIGGGALVAVAGLSDLGSGVYNTAAPALKTLTGKLKESKLAAKLLGRESKIASGVTKIWTGVQAGFNAVMSLNPVVLIVLAIIGLVAVIIIAYKKSERFRKIVHAAFTAVKNVARSVWNWIKSHWPLLLEILTGPIGLAVVYIVKHWKTIKNAGIAVWNWLKALPGRIANVFKSIGSAISSPFISAFNAIRNFWNSTLGGKGFSIPSWVPLIGGHSFSIPYFHTGGIVGGSGDQLAMLKGGEGVFTREQMAAMGNGSNRIVIEVTGSGDEFRTWLKKSIRVHGGDPAVLGA